METEILTDSFCRIRDKLHRVACRLLKDELEAQDAVQDTFCNLWISRLPDTPEEARYRLFAILKNVCINKLKRKHATISVDEFEIGVAETEFDDCDKITSLITSTLSPLQQQIFQLSVLEELEYDVIACRLNMSIEAVRMNMSRIRKKIREKYNQL